MSSPSSAQVILLGASNLWASLPTALAQVRAGFAGPARVLLACGPGRSYGLKAGTFLARYPGIGQTGLFADIDPGAPAFAWLTDVGNDLLYGQPAEKVADFVSSAIDRLTALGARVALTDLPLEALAKLTERRYLLVRNLTYPGCRIPYREMLSRVIDLDGRLQALRGARSVKRLTGRPRWYSADRFHFSPWRHDAIWQTWIGALAGHPAPGHRSARPWRSLFFEPRHYWLLGRKREGRGFYPGVLRDLDVSCY